MQRVLSAILARCKRDGDCVIWTGATERGGYGHARFKGRTLAVHRVVWEFINGAVVPVGYHVLHTCDNPPCIWPPHLWIGTTAQNNLDCRLKRRHNIGEVNGNARLTEDQVRAILADTRYQRVIAADYGTTQRQVSRIKLREQWKVVADG